MTSSNLTADAVRELLNYDPETGALTWRTSRRGDLIGKRAGGLGHSGGYRSLGIGRNKYLEHRIIYLHVTGVWPDVIDHINGDRLDNRWANLRNTTPMVNAQNIKRAQVNNKAGYLGVVWIEDRKVYVSRLYTNGKYINVGRFKCPEEAAEAYLEAKRKFHEGCTI